MNTSTYNVDKKSFQFKNPFVVESPEKLAPQQIVDLFIEKYTRIETIKQRRHTFIWGSRGSGKSMMLRYLEPKCQAIVHGKIEDFLSQSESFIAVYCPCKEGQINKNELNLLSEQALLVITDHMLNLNIADRLINCLIDQFPDNYFTKDDCKDFAKKVLQLFDVASIASSIEQANASVSVEAYPLNWLQELFAEENKRVSTFLRNNAIHGGGTIYKGATSGYHDFLFPMIKYMQNFPPLNSVPIYLLLDDADKLSKEQQWIINTWIANRDQAIVCLKISARHEGYKTLYTRDKGIIEQPHDYSEVDVEELYTRSKSDYSEKVKLIANKRLELSNLPTQNIEEFLPTDSREEGLLKQFKEETAKEWEEVGKPGSQEDYTKRYATARLFQHLKASKQRKSYAGFQNMVHISSGIVRDFLEPCYLMFDECVSKGEDSKSIRLISASLQNSILHDYSEELLLKRFKVIKKELAPESWTTLESLRTLIESLGRLFYERLHDKEAREARLFSFTVNGTLPRDIAGILELGVRYRYFQLRTYSTKDGGGRENWYILNRRLCPIFKLDPTGFEGRITLTPELLKLACEHPDKFVRLRLKKSGDMEQQNWFSFTDEETV